jgi:hypothetical protein
MRFWAAFGRFVVGLVCLALLTSIGGAGIFAAPVTLPVLWFAAHSARPLGRALLDLVAALTAAEVAWAVAYAAWGDAALLTRVVPVCAGLAVAVLYPLSQRSGGRRLVA